MSRREFLYTDGEGVHQAFEPDMAEELDTPAEIMAEKFAIPLPTANAIHADFARTMEVEVERQVAARLDEMTGFYMTGPAKNLHAKLLGVAFSRGLARPLNGIRNMSDVARKSGCTRALISYYKRKADLMFGNSGRLFGKSEKACATYSKVRVQVVVRTYAENYGVTDK